MLHLIHDFFKLVRPEFSNFVTREQTNQIFALIEKLIQVLASSEVSIDDRHTPNCTRVFLRDCLQCISQAGRRLVVFTLANRRIIARCQIRMGMVHRDRSIGAEARRRRCSMSQRGTSPQHGTSQRAFTGGPPGSAGGVGSGGVPDLISHQQQAGVPSPLSMSSSTPS